MVFGILVARVMIFALCGVLSYNSLRPRQKPKKSHGPGTAEIVLPTQELRDDIPFFQKVLGMRMDTIFPADDPSVAVFSGTAFAFGWTRTRPRSRAKYGF